jgi:N-acetylglucosamine kinase-like BadF-type ATPase
MILIADSGGTKTQWCGISGSGESEIITTIGLNPNFVADETFGNVLSGEVLPRLKSTEIDELWFYGAGCGSRIASKRVQDLFSKIFRSAKINVLSDLTGAAKGLLGTGSGYVCMIGTGSNSGYYNGERITENVPPLGFILGDEGSGAALGRKLLADYLRGIMPQDLSDEFRKRYGAEKDDVVSQVYSGVFPSRFIGGFVQFIRENISADYCRNLVRTSFEEFVERNLRLYKTFPPVQIAVTGSVAWYFSEILGDVFTRNGFTITLIVREPIEGLIRFHKQLFISR